MDRTDATTTTKVVVGEPSRSGPQRRALARVRGAAWAVILVADVGLLAWAAMAAAAPEHLIGPGSRPILPAGYEGFTGASWQALATASPRTTEYATLLFRMFGLYGVAFSLLAIAIAATAFRRGDAWAWWALLVGNTLAYAGAMAYDQIVHAVGPFELTEYFALGAIYASLLVTAPFGAHRARRSGPSERIPTRSRPSSGPPDVRGRGWRR